MLSCLSCLNTLIVCKEGWAGGRCVRVGELSETP